MKRSIIGAAAATAMMGATFAPAQAGMSGLAATGNWTKASADTAVEQIRWRRRHHRGAAIGAGIVTLGILGAIAASEARRDRYYEGPRYRYRSRCARWRRWCRDGDDRACWRYDSRC